MEKEFNPHEVLKDNRNLLCTCPETDCEWHGKCKECVALHKYMSTVPSCLDFVGKPTVIAVCTSNLKGEIKIPVDEIHLKAGYGIEGDAHAGKGIRQVSLLAIESVDKLREKMPEISAGAFAENILTSGICLHEIPIGTNLRIGDTLLEITKIGKSCHNDGCAIKQQTGECVMPREGIFAVVLTGGTIKAGMKIDAINAEGTAN